MKKTYIRYSEAFKRHVVKEIEEGKFNSLREAAERVNGILKYEYGLPDMVHENVYTNR